MGFSRACSNHVVVVFFFSAFPVMDSLAISILPLDDQEEEFALFKPSASGHFFVGVQKKRASNVLSVLSIAPGMSCLDL